MVVDDSLTVRKITGRLLAKEGYQVLTAKDGVDALQQLQDIRPAVMLVDIEMPRMDGFELTKNVRGDAATGPGTFRYLNRDVFAGRGAPPRTAGARIRFFLALDRPLAEGGDTVVMVRERPVPPGGRVDESGLPAGQPMFEQLLDAHGRALRGPLGPAHVLGLNAGTRGATLECRGCHVGHSRRR